MYIDISAHHLQQVQLLPHEVVDLAPDLGLHLDLLLVLDDELVHALPGVVGLVPVGPGGCTRITMLMSALIIRFDVRANMKFLCSYICCF